MVQFEKQVTVATRGKCTAVMIRVAGAHGWTRAAWDFAVGSIVCAEAVDDLRAKATGKTKAVTVRTTAIRTT